MYANMKIEDHRCPTTAAAFSLLHFGSFLPISDKSILYERMIYLAAALGLLLPNTNHQPFSNHPPTLKHGNIIAASPHLHQSQGLAQLTMRVYNLGVVDFDPESRSRLNLYFVTSYYYNIHR